MSTRLRRKVHVLIFAAMASIWASRVTSAQAPDHLPIASSVAALKARVPIGSDVHVTDSSGATMKGRLAGVADDMVQVSVGAGVRGVATADVRRIQWQQHDSPFTGVLIGAGIGAIPGIYWLAADPNECAGMCPEEYGFITIGAVVGGLLDHAIKRKVTVYRCGFVQQPFKECDDPAAHRERAHRRSTVGQVLKAAFAAA